MASNYLLMRNFIALMRSFGYPRVLSIENFRNPNFPLMADVLIYLLKRFDSNTEIDANIDTEQGRLKFVMAASHLMVNKANLDINVKKLYMADINSVQEMTKLAKLIQEAWNSLNRKDIIPEEDETDVLETGSGVDHSTALSKFNNFKTTQITSEIFQVATKLYDAIAEHDQNRDHLQKSLGRQLAIDQIETSIRQSIRQLQQDMLDMQNRQEVLDRDNEDMNSKIEKRMAELNRNKKRLQNLYSQRPAYMDELEKIEEEIVGLYDQYVVNSRSLSFLEQKLEEFEELERLKIAERNQNIKQMLEQIKIDDFLKNGTLSVSQNGGDERSSTNDDLALIVDIDEDALGRVSGSDFSDKDINEVSRNSESRRERQKTDPINQKLRSDKKDRLLMANTVTVKSQRLSGVKQQQQQQQQQPQPAPNGNRRSAKTARVYGSLLENEDDDDDSRSDGDAKMSDSEIDLDAIDDTDDDDTENSAMIDFEKSMSNGELVQNIGNLKIPNFNNNNHDNKIDDNF